MELESVVLDPETRVFFLVMPQSKVVLLQAFFELYEGLGLVRTLNMREGLIAVLTTASLSNDCQEVLMRIKDNIEWSAAPTPDSEMIDRYLGYFSHASDNSKI